MTLPNARIQTLLLDAPSIGPYVIPGFGHAFQILRASSKDANIDVKLEDGRLYTVYAGGGWHHGAYNRLELTWDAQPGQWIEWAAYGEQAHLDPRLFEFIGEDKSVWASISKRYANQLDTAGAIAFNGRVTASTPQTIYTVPAGAQLLINKMQIETNTSFYCEARIYDDAAAVRSYARAMNAEMEIWEGFILDAGYSITFHVQSGSGATGSLSAQAELLL